MCRVSQNDYDDVSILLKLLQNTKTFFRGDTISYKSCFDHFVHHSTFLLMFCGIFLGGGGISCPRYPHGLSFSSPLCHPSCSWFAHSIHLHLAHSFPLFSHISSSSLHLIFLITSDLFQEPTPLYLISPTSWSILFLPHCTLSCLIPTSSSLHYKYNRYQVIEPMVLLDMALMHKLFHLKYSPLMIITLYQVTEPTVLLDIA